MYPAPTSRFSGTYADNSGPTGIYLFNSIYRDALLHPRRRFCTKSLGFG